MSSWMIWTIGGTVLLFLLGYIRLYRHYRRNIRKVAFMFDAIDNVDYSFKFSTEKVSRDDRMLNSALNRIKLILARARKEAFKRERYYEQIINSVDTGIVVVDEKGNVRQHNDAALRLTGVSVLTHLDQLKRVGTELYRQVRDILPGEKRQVTVSNEKGETHLSLKAVQTLLQGCRVRLLTISDINTELDDNALDSWMKLIRVLTHEMMNAVTPITSLSETLLQKADGEMCEGLEVIHRTSMDLMAFVDNYRKFTHIPTPVPTLFYIKPFLERMVRLAREQTGFGGIVIQTDVSPADLIVYADEALIGHVMTNLLKNAIQALEGKGQIWIGAFCNDQEAVVIDVSDDGLSIPDEVARHIFVPFFTTKGEGSGIGLPVARQIMRLSGGTLTLKPERDNGRTTFELVFP